MGSHDQESGDDYNITHMKFLDDIEHVRHRSAMYIGDLGNDGLHHLVHEVIDNSIDEVMAGYATRIQVSVFADGSIEIQDDGRGIPVDYDTNIGKSSLEGALTVLKYSAKFENAAYAVSGGLHGMGLKTVNFLSTACRVTVHRSQRTYVQTYASGTPDGPVEDQGPTQQRGTTIWFSPDPAKFGDLVFDRDALRRRLQDVAFLNRGLRVDFIDQRDPPSNDSFQYSCGLQDFIKLRNADNDPIHDEVVILTCDTKSMRAEVAFQFVVSEEESIDCYANNVHNRQGGTHLRGFRSGLIRALRGYGKLHQLFRKFTPSAEDFREGLVAVVAVRLADPQFESQHKLRLTNIDVEHQLGAEVFQQVSKYLEEHPQTAKAILRRVQVAAEARELARSKRRDFAKARRASTGLPGKLRDCTSNDRTLRELYLVEGDSAGGSAEGGRIRETQAILPLRGKLINAFKARQEKVLANEEIQSIIQAVGIGIGEQQDLELRRYDKIIIMTDADVDGSHIRTLLLSFFYRQMLPLIEEGHVYVAQPPLYRVRRGKETFYVQTDTEMRSQLLNNAVGSVELREREAERSYQGESLRILCEAIDDLDQFITGMERRGRNGLEPLATASLLFQGDGKRYPIDLATIGISPTELESLRQPLETLLHLGIDVARLDPALELGQEAPRFVVRRKDHKIPLPKLRELPSVVRSLGEKGLQVTRFKGLGEMNADELRETTLAPEHRILTRIQLEDVAAADHMFGLLMGDDVRPRRSFIAENAWEITNLDV